MTKKDYKLIADVFRIGRNFNDTLSVNDMALRLAKQFQATQPNFDFDKFMSACSPWKEKTNE